MIEGMTTIARHRTAMSHSFLSRPMQQAHSDGLLNETDDIFDYGCGRGRASRWTFRVGLTWLGNTVRAHAEMAATPTEAAASACHAVTGQIHLLRSPDEP